MLFINNYYSSNRPLRIMRVYILDYRAARNYWVHLCRIGNTVVSILEYHRYSFDQTQKKNRAFKLVFTR